MPAIGLTLVPAICATAIMAFTAKAVPDLRPTPEAEHQGLDYADHGEESYPLEVES